MARLQYYEDERARWPALSAAKPVGEAEALAGLRALGRKFGLPLKGVSIGFTSGRRGSRAGYYSITLNLTYLNWRTIVHEFAHTYHKRKLADFRRPVRWHGRVHRRLMERFCPWVMEQEWHLGTLAHEVALELERALREKLRERVAAEPPPIEARIAHREMQIKRLERRVKALTTRMKGARRSLAALKRVAAKKPCTAEESG